MQTRWRRLLVVGAAILLVLLVIRLGGSLFVLSGTPPMDVQRGSDPTTLIVALHGFGGEASRNGLLALAQAAYPDADLLAPLLMTGPLRSFSNQDPYAIADAIEEAIDEAFRARRYQRIILVGHSMGGELMRKAFVWGSGQEDDRPGNHRGKHEWVEHVERIVSLASINRGWSIDPKPATRGAYRQLSFRIGTYIAWLTGTGRLMLALQRGAPFIADLRVQWINLARSAHAAVRLPYVIHLLGTRDDIASIDDIKDVRAAKDYKFKSISETDHGAIAASLTTELRDGKPVTPRARKVLEVMTLPIDQIATDPEDEMLVERLDVTRVLFILHGIRDYDFWGKQLEQAIVDKLGKDSTTAVVVPKYGHFAMLPFLLWRDRQENVRWFMDVYTETKAQYPRAEFDFIGHSNGTYILASALQRYRTLQVHDVYFAGSVVPQRYPWDDLIRRHRVHRVRNVVATGDWVVAIFPRLYEQIAEWGKISQVTGYFDIGAAGFRGFRFFGEPRDAVRDLTFSAGAHGTGVDIGEVHKRDALIRFAEHGLDDEQEKTFGAVFQDASAQSWFWDAASNVSWLVWLLLVAIVGGLGVLAWRLHWAAGGVYTLLILGLLNSF